MQQQLAAAAVVLVQAVVLVPQQALSHRQVAQAGLPRRWCSPSSQVEHERVWCRIMCERVALLGIMVDGRGGSWFWAFSGSVWI